MDVLEFIEDKYFLIHWIYLNTNHMSYAFVYLQLLVVFQVSSVVGNLPYQLINVGFFLIFIFLNEHVLGHFWYFEESLTGHILNTRMLLMHEFIKFLDNCLQECPMTAQESRELTNDIHYIGCNKCFVTFA